MANLHVTNVTSLSWAPHRAFAGVSARTVVDAQTGSDLEVKLVRVAPGAEIGLHTHEGCAETFYVLEGQGLICTEDTTQPCHPGICVHAKSGTVHGVRNSGEGELYLLAIFTPPSNTPPPSGGRDQTKSNP